MVDEARHTDRSYNRKLSSRRLEKRTMDFVSAGSASQTTNPSLQQQQPSSIHSRPLSPNSVSSEEIILFTGRNKSALPTTCTSQTQSLNHPIEQLHVGGDPEYHRPLPIITSGSKPVRKTFSSSRPLDLSDDDNIDEELLADYIVNMDSSWDDVSRDISRDVGTAKNGVDKGKKAARFAPIIVPLFSTDNWPTTQPVASKTETETPTGNQAGPSNNQAASHNKDFNYTRSVTSILSQRNGDAGMFYLVVYDNQDDDTAEWVESDSLLNMTSSALQFFENPMWETEDSESVDSEIQAERDLADMFNDEAIEDKQLKKRQARMTDEEIAIRLAKQEEFGIDTSDVVMFDGLEGPDEPIEYLHQEAVRYNLRTRKVLHRRDSEGSSDFDLVDRKRSSLWVPNKKRKKKKNKQPIFGVVDSDMERSMLAAWENDRVKKKQRKQDREELRAQGLLGGGAKAKYPDGISLDELKEEFRAFLSSDRTTMLLPPMHKTDRQLVHEIAHNFNLKSTSQGTGPNRHATLNKKVRARPFTDAAFNGVVNRLLKRFHASKLGGSKWGPGKKQFSYREGDVVGSDAPELGSENRGRAMLEKMGWNNGDALGATNNPGILNPIAHVVRGSRSGLG